MDVFNNVPLSDEEMAEEKNRLIKIINPELKEHGLVDLTDFINKKSTERFQHPGFVRSIAYRMEEMGIVEVIPRKEWNEFYVKRTIWSKRHPYWYALKLGGIGLVFSILAGASIAVTQAIIKDRQPKQESITIKCLYDSVLNLRQDIKTLHDSLTNVRRKKSNKELGSTRLEGL